nr:hypothetical protein [Methylomarinum sp. Ch1-1]MDP4520500.1 hypothetical protein [Methylomarinum sp. Ch1-1]
MKRIKNGALPLVSTPYPHRRAASRSKPPKTATRAKLGRVI